MGDRTPVGIPLGDGVLVSGVGGDPVGIPVGDTPPVIGVGGGDPVDGVRGLSPRAICAESTAGLPVGTKYPPLGVALPKPCRSEEG